MMRFWVTLAVAAPLVWLPASWASSKGPGSFFAVEKMMYSPFGERIYSTGAVWHRRGAWQEQPVLDFWNGQTGRSQRVIPRRPLVRLHVGASRGKPLVVIGEYNYARVLDGRTGRLLKAFHQLETDHDDFVNVWAVSPDGETVLFSVQREQLDLGFLWNWRSGLSPRRFFFHGTASDFGAAAAFSPDGRTIISTERVSRVLGHVQLRVYSQYQPYLRGQINYVTLPKGFWPQATQLSADTNLLAVAGDLRFKKSRTLPYGDPVRRQFVLLWNREKKRGRLIRCARARSGFNVAFSSGGRLLAVAEQTRVRILDLMAGRVLREAYAKRHGFSAFTICAFSPDGTRLAVGGLGPKKIAIFKLNGGRKS